MAVIEEGDVDCGVPGGCEVVSNDGFVEGAVFSPDVQQAAQEAMNEVKTAADPSMIHIVRDDSGNIDPMATLTASTKLFPSFMPAPWLWGALVPLVLEKPAMAVDLENEVLWIYGFRLIISLQLR